MSNDFGWISLHRSLQNNFLWDDKPFAMGQAWVDLLMLANREDKKAVSQGKIVEFKRGTVNRSILWLSDRWGWDRKKTRKFLKILEIEKMATTTTSTHGTTITIVNYDVYQDSRDNKKDNKKDNRGTTTGQPLPTNNKDNNINNINKKREGENKSRRFTPPTIEQVREYCTQRHNNIDPESFVSFYSSKNWYIGKTKMSDWKQAVITWEKRDKQKNQSNVRNFAAPTRFEEHQYDEGEMEKLLLDN